MKAIQISSNSRTDESLFIGKPKDFWCSSLNYSCKADVLTTPEIEKTPEAIVWFENGGKTLYNNFLKDKILRDSKSCSKCLNEYVWFDENTGEPKEIIETRHDTIFKSDEDELMKKVIDSVNMLI